MYSVTKGSIWEIWDEVDFTALEEAISQAVFWVAEYPEQEVIIYTEKGQPVKAWMCGQITFEDKRILKEGL